MTSQAWERVYTVNDFYDGPRLGVANLRGKPHIYEAEFGEALDDYTGSFWLRENDQHLLTLVLEDCEVWLRWQQAYKQGSATIESHPALPDDRARHDEIARFIGDQLTVKAGSPVLKLASFRGGVPNDLEVAWTDP
jgi:hypothetical protein